MKINILLLTTIALLAFYCKRSNTIQSKQVNKHNVFYKVTNRPLSRYFKNSADTALLGRIVYTGYLSKTKFENDTIESFLIKLGLCNNDMSEQVYIPCLPAFETIIKINDSYQNYDTIIGTKNALPEYYGYPYEDDNGILTEIFIKNKNTDIYSNPQFLLALIGYYLDKSGNKSIVVHDDVLNFDKAYLDNALVLYKWQNGKYVPDSLLTIDGELIPKEDYPQAYEKYMGDSDY
ncbi:MAG: hypothetical protein IPL33_17210 [Sphingobacteriales bacterium]|nr:hypothetical protein [Sphingobacteriales bacterium]